MLHIWAGDVLLTASMHMHTQFHPKFTRISSTPKHNLMASYPDFKIESQHLLYNTNLSYQWSHAKRSQSNKLIRPSISSTQHLNSQSRPINVLSFLSQESTHHKQVPRQIYPLITIQPTPLLHLFQLTRIKTTHLSTFPYLESLHIYIYYI